MTSYIPRDLAPKILNLTPPKAVVVLGPRRCGKTTMLETLLNGQPRRWFNGDEPLTAQSLNFQSRTDAVTTVRLAPNIVIDEAQKIPNIGNILKMLVEANEELAKPARIFVTGSSSLSLAKGLRESAVGRIIERKMWPLGVHEIATERGWAHMDENLGNYLVHGMFPAVVCSPENAREILDGYCNGILFRDIFELAEIRLHEKFFNLVKLLAWQVGSEVSYDSLAKEVGISKDAVQNYIVLMQQCGLIEVCPSFSKNLGNELKKGKKIYFCDNGIRNCIIGDFSAFWTRPDAGALWENFFFMERRKIHDTIKDFKRMYFWRTKGNKPHEIDFLEEIDSKLHAFECKLSNNIKANPGADFLRAYPDCPIDVVTPLNALKFLGMQDFDS